jgi:hypothetical protein
LFPGGGEDRCGRGGPSGGGSDAGRLASTAAWAGLVGAPWLARVQQLRCPGERLVCGQPVPGRGMVSGVVVQVRGGSVIFGVLAGELAWSAVLAHVLVGRGGRRAVRACGGAVAQQVGSFVGSCVVEVFSKKVDYQLGRPDLNQRPLDPQSRSGRRWAWLCVAQWGLDQA